MYLWGDEDRVSHHRRIVIPESLTEFEPSMFRGDYENPFYPFPNLTSVEVDPTNKAFYSENNCLIDKETMELVAGGASGIIPSRVESIGHWAFAHREQLEKLYIPASVTSISERAFVGCTRMASIEVDPNNKRYYSEGDCLIERETNEMILGCRQSVVPASVTHIYHGAFRARPSIMKVDPDNENYYVDGNCIIEKNQHPGPRHGQEPHPHLRQGDRHLRLLRLPRTHRDSHSRRRNRD